MKLIQLKCPSCGAKLEVNPNLDKYTCNYCGVTTVLDDEKIVVKNVSSKLQNALLELEEYYENGNYKKCHAIAQQLLEEYPKNKEIKEYYDKCHEELFGEEERRQKRIEEERQRRLEEARKQRAEWERQRQEEEQKKIAEQQAKIQAEQERKAAKQAKIQEATDNITAVATVGVKGIFFVGNIIAYICAGFFLLGGIFAKFNDPVSRITTILFGISLMKIIYTKIGKILKLSNKTLLICRIVIPITIIVIGSTIGMNLYPTDNNKTQEETNTNTTTVVAN